MDLLPFLLDANLSATNPPAIPHWWKRQPLIPTLLSQELKNYLKLNVKEKNIQIADQVIIDETAGEVVIGANTRICHGAVIQGPVVIGANCLIGNWICPYISRHLLSLNPLQARCRRYSRGER